MNCVSLATDGIVLWKLGRPCYTGTVRGHCPLSENWVSVHFCQGHCPGLVQGTVQDVVANVVTDTVESVLSIGLDSTVQCTVETRELHSCPAYCLMAPLLSSFQQTDRGLFSCPALCSNAPLLSSKLPEESSPVQHSVRELHSCPVYWQMVFLLSGALSDSLALVLQPVRKLHPSLQHPVPSTVRLVHCPEYYRPCSTPFSLRVQGWPTPLSFYTIHM